MCLAATAVAAVEVMTSLRIIFGAGRGVESL